MLHRLGTSRCVRALGTRTGAAGVSNAAWSSISQQERGREPSPAFPLAHRPPLLGRSAAGRRRLRGAALGELGACATPVTQRTSSLCFGLGASLLCTFPCRGGSQQEVRGYLCTVLVCKAEFHQQVLPNPVVFPCSRGVAPAAAASPLHRELSQHGRARSDLIPREGSCANRERWEVTRRPRAELPWASRSQGW